MVSVPSALCIGWAPRSDRSMIASLRWVKPTRPSAENQSPLPSGPRGAMRVFMRDSSTRSTGGATSR